MSTITSSNSPLNLSTSPADDNEPSPDYSMWLHLEDTPETSSLMDGIEGLAGLPQFLSSTSWEVR